MCTKSCLFRVCFLATLICSLNINAFEDGHADNQLMFENMSAIKSKVQSIQSKVKENQQWLKDTSCLEQPRISRRMVTATCVLLAAGITPFVFANPSSSQSRFIGPLSALIARPVVKYGLFALGWFGSVMLARVLFPVRPRKLVDEFMRRAQNLLDPIQHDLSEVETNVEEFQKLLGSAKLKIRTLTEEQAEQKRLLDDHQAKIDTAGRGVHTLTLDMGQVKEANRSIEDSLGKIINTPVSGRETLSGRGQGRNPFKTPKVRPESDPLREHETKKAVELNFLKTHDAVKSDLTQLSKEAVVLKAQLDSLKKHEHEQFSDSTTGARPLSPNAIMYQTIINFLERIPEAVKKSAGEPRSAKSTDTD